MTKVRAPLSIDNALARIAGQLPGGWAEMGELFGVTAGTMRKWGDEDQPGQLSMSAAIALDIAFERAGGLGHPIFQTYERQLERAREQAFKCEAAIARQHGVVLRELGQAHAAVVIAALPGATEVDQVNALRETEEALDELTGLVGLLSQSRAPPDTS